MGFYLGKPVLVMLAIALLGGAWIVVQPPPGRADLMVWTFADLNAKSYRTPLGDTPAMNEQFKMETGHSVEINLLMARALDVRLISLFMSNAIGDRVPDLAEVEISNIGKFFRPPPKDIGFVPLNHFLERDGWMPRLVQSRLKAWSKQGQIFLLPHDVHPLTITYRKDLFDQAGVDLAAAKTWPEFHQACLKFQNYWHQQGNDRRMAIELPLLSSEGLIIMLLQRGVNIVDDTNHPHFDDPKVAPTTLAYCLMVAGPGRIANDLIALPAQMVKDLNTGETCALLTPDWRMGYIRAYGEVLTGKLRMIPLPRFDPTDAPTATWGGTGMGIPKNCKDPELSWKLMEKLYLNPESLKVRRQFADVLSPVMDSWNDPSYQKPDPFLGGQKAGAMYTELARQIPVKYATPYTLQASAFLNEVIYRTTMRIKAGQEANLETDVRSWLAQAQAEMQRRINFGSMD